MGAMIGRGRRRAGAVLLLAAALSPALPAAGQATVLELGFDAYGGGLYLAHGTLHIDLEEGRDGRRYDARLDASGSHWIDFFTGFSYQAEAAGRLEPSAVPLPDSFRGERRLRSKHDVMALRFAGPEVEVQAEPPLSPEKAARVPAAARRGSIDPLSIGVGLIAAAVRAGDGCSGRYPAFDGRRRYDISLTPLGTADLAPSSRSIAAGPARVCALALRPVAGFQMDHDPKAFFVDHTDRSALVWFAPPQPGAPSLPVRVEVTTDFGVFYVHAVSFQQSP